LFEGAQRANTDSLLCVLIETRLAVLLKLHCLAEEEVVGLRVPSLVMEPERGGMVMNIASRSSSAAGGSILQVGRSVGILAVVVIVLLSASVTLIVYSELRESEALARMLEDPNQLLVGFVLLMLLTVGYLVGKGWSTTRYQRRLIEQLMEEEAIARAQRLDPITQFHHPDVCRDVLLRQAGYSNRLCSPLSLLELTIPSLHKWSLGAASKPQMGDLIRQMRRLCRPIDTLVRWTPDSFLLAFPEVTAQELPGVTLRIRNEIEGWFKSHVDGAAPAIRARAVTSQNLGLSGDILLEVNRLLENQTPGSLPESVPAPDFGRREKSVGLALDLRITGVDREGQPFQEAVVTERVASDRVWFALKKPVPTNSDLKIAFHDGSFLESAKITRLLERGKDQLVEAQFAHPPENWVIREA